jgi:hypothetical protein
MRSSDTARIAALTGSATSIGTALEINLRYRVVSL